MHRRDLFRAALALPSLAVPFQPQAAWPFGSATQDPVPSASRTVVAIDGERFRINGALTYPGRTYRGHRVEGLLMNSRMVQGVFDDMNPETRARWAYPDTGRWDADRNTREFLAAMPEWRRHGLLAFTLNLQGGSPEGYSKAQPWHNSAFETDGTLRPAYLDRVRLILDRADALGMVVILGYFYFGQDERLRDEAAVVRGVRTATRWLLDGGWRHVIVEVNNECDVPRYEHDILTPARVSELISLVRGMTVDGRRLLVGTSFGGGTVPTDDVVRASDLVLIHGNGVKDPRRITAMVEQTRALPGWTPKPIVFNEDDHFDFDQPANNMTAAVAAYASWGYFDPGANDYALGYQCPPVQWAINTERKRAFFGEVRVLAGG